MHLNKRSVLHTSRRGFLRYRAAARVHAITASSVRTRRDRKRCVCDTAAGQFYLSRAQIGFDLSQTQKTSRFHSGHFRAFMRAGSMIAPMDYGPRGGHGVQLLQRKGGARTHDHLLVRKWFGIPIFNTNILIENLSIFEKCLHHIIVRN